MWDSIVASRGSVRGPFKVLLHAPEIAAQVGELGAFVRFKSSLDPHVRELAGLVTAVILECDYETAVHAQNMRAAGVSEATVGAILEQRFADLPAEDRWICELAQQVLVEHRVDAAAVAEAHARLGSRGLIELTSTIGYFAMLAVTLNTVELPAPARAS